MNIIETLIKAKEYYDKGETCTIRLHNLTSNSIYFNSIGTNKDFEAATPPPLSIKAEEYGDTILNASKFWSSTLNLLYNVYHSNNTYVIHINYIWEEKTKGKIQVKIYDQNNDLLIPQKENFVGLFKTYQIKNSKIPFHINYMASGDFIELEIKDNNL